MCAVLIVLFVIDSKHSKNNNLFLSVSVDLSLVRFITTELTRGYFLEHNEAKYTERRERVYTCLRIPKELEKVNTLYTPTLKEKKWNEINTVVINVFLPSLPVFSWWHSASSSVWTPSSMCLRCCPSGWFWPCCDSSQCHVVVSGNV